MKPGSQNERVLRMLRFAGSRGLTQLEMDVPTLGGGPVRRLASRINDLRDAGYVITTIGRRNKMAVYRLDREPAPEDRESRSSVELAPALIERRPANAVLGWDA